MFAASLAVAVLFALVAAQRALAATHIGTTTYASNTTWTLANSPYILDGNVTVAAGATLTIEPGVVVKFNGQFRTLNVNGTLSAVGTAASHIVFTSYQDDSAAGDSNGDGTATVGAPGQWYNISLRSSGNQLAYTDVRYGGYGTGQLYAPVYVYGNGYGVTIDHAVISDNQQSAIVVGNRATATIKDSTLSNNAYGVYVNAGSATIDRTTISNNSARGIWFNLPTLNPAPAASTITSSEITQNGGYGVYLIANGDYPLASMPTGISSNIYANNSGGTQLYSDGYPSFKRADVNWRGNYWGDNVYYWYGAAGCAGTAPNSPGHLAYRSSSGNVPAGPISSGTYLAGTSWCGYDRFKIDECDFYGAKLDGAPQEPWCQTFGSEHGKDTTEEFADPVNSATGSFEHTESDLSLPGPGVPFSFARSYNSLDLTKGPLGQGWTHTFAASLTVKANGDVALRGGDGQKMEYAKQQDGSFIGATGTLSTLSLVSGEYELTRVDQVKYRFNAQGRLTSLVDRNGQGLTLGYGGDAKLATVTDAAGRVVTFTHNANGLLTGINVPNVGSISYAYTNGQLTSFTDLNANVWTYTYEAHGFLAGQVDPRGNRQFLNTYGGDGRVTEQLDALNDATTFSWDQSTQTATATDARGNAWKDVYAGNVLTKRIDALGNTTQLGHNTSLDRTSVTSPAGAMSTMTHDARGNVLTVTAPSSLGSATKTYTYDARNNVSSVTDARGKVTSYGYDATGNNTSITQDGATIAQFTRNASGQLTSSTDGNGGTTTYTYDGNGNVASVTDPLGSKTTYSYDAAGRVTARVDPRGNVPGADPNQHKWSYTYDAAGNLLTETDPLGNTTAHAYDAAGNRTSVTNANGKTTTYTYDAANRLASVTAPDGGVTNYTYDAVGNKIAAKNPNNKTTAYAYDADNRLISVTTSLGNKTTYSYDSRGNLIKQVDPRGNVQAANPDDYATTYTYDAAGRLLTETDPLGNATTYAYDSAGNRSSVTDGNNHTTTYSYDGRSRLVSVTAPGGPATSYTYDGNDNLLTRTDANNHVTTYAYDGANRMTSTTLPVGRQWTYTSDADGNLTQVVNANGNATPAPGDGTTTFGYDRAGRRSSIDYSGATPDVTFSYDGAGNRAQMTDGAGTQTYTYDALNRLTAVTRGTDTFSYAYDLAGKTTRLTYPDATVVDYTYDDDARLSTVTSGGQTTSYSYDAAAHLTQTTLPAANGHVDERTYDRAGRLTRVKNIKGINVLSDFSYTLDPVGNPTQVVRAGSTPGTTTYAYDARDRLTEVCFQASCPGGSDPFIRWTYDPVGNRLTEARPTGTTAYSYDDADRLTQAGSTTYAYDDNGNQTQAGSRTFGYDLANRLASTNEGGSTTTYAYDGDGNRVRATAGSQVTKFVWDTNRPRGQIALERDGSDALVRRYVYGHRRISLAGSSGVSYYHHDRVGSVANVTSSSGAAQWSYAYEPFGAVRTESPEEPTAPENPMKFAGELFDPNGFYHLRARDYAPIIGRFTSPDPAAPSKTDPYVASYVYVADRPTVMVDPSGMTFEPIDDGEETAEDATSPVDEEGADDVLGIGIQRHIIDPGDGGPTPPGGDAPSPPGGGGPVGGGGGAKGPDVNPPGAVLPNACVGGVDLGFNKRVHTVSALGIVTCLFPVEIIQVRLCITVGFLGGYRRRECSRIKASYNTQWVHRVKVATCSPGLWRYRGFIAVAVFDRARFGYDEGYSKARWKSC